MQKNSLGRRIKDRLVAIWDGTVHFFWLVLDAAADAFRYY